jgi:cyclopropane fatty-acyl-phospholipid synthase-like methyltransferase
LFDIVKKKYNYKIKRVLDFGCGIGSNIPFIFKNFKNIEYYAYDNNSSIVESLNRANNIIYKKKIHYLNKNEIFKINENFFDLIIVDACAMYFSKKEIFKYFNLFNKITSKSILIHDLNHFNEKIIIKKMEGKNIINYNNFFKKINPDLKLTFQKSHKPGYPWHQFGYIILIEKYKPLTD